MEVALMPNHIKKIFFVAVVCQDKRDQIKYMYLLL